MMSPAKSERVPKASQPAYQAIIDLTGAVCLQYLNDEYATLARRLAAALARKRPSPIPPAQASPYPFQFVG